MSNQRVATAAALLYACGLLSGQATYPSAPFVSNVGRLHCGIRMYAAGQVQTWCFLGSFPDQRLVHNTIDGVQLGSVRRLAVVEGPDQIEWVVSWLDVALPVQYQLNTNLPDGWQQGVLGDLDPAMPGRPVLAGVACMYFCCVSPDPVSYLFSRSGTPTDGMMFQFALARMGCAP